MVNNSSKYNLHERTQDYGKKIIRLCKSVKFSPVSSKIVDQLVRSGTSIGANYMEAVNGSSKRDFKNKIFICKKEAQETKYWLEMLKEAEPVLLADINELANECHELNLIFQKTITTLEANLKIDK